MTNETTGIVAIVCMFSPVLLLPLSLLFFDPPTEDVVVEEQVATEETE